MSEQARAGDELLDRLGCSAKQLVGDRRVDADRDHVAVALGAIDDGLRDEVR
jgi:hypothetical protein